MKIKGPGKVLLILLLVGGLFAAKTFWWDKRPQEVREAVKIDRIILPDAPEASLNGSNAIKLPLPTTKPAFNGGTEIRWNIMAWQSQNSLVLANGGLKTTKESLIDKAKLDITLNRQDNCSQSVTEMVKFIEDYKENPSTPGFFMTFMGSGIPAYFYTTSKAVEHLGPEYQPIIFLTSGKSYGEDQVIGDIKYKRNPQLLRGAVCRGVRMDGDIDLILKFCADNNIPVNANEKTYDVNALNLSYTPDFLQAVVDYNSNLQEKRKLVKDGRTTGKDTIVGIDLVGTWTPGDVNAINGRGGVTIISTRDYASMMPNITITCKKWLNDHRTDVENLIVALSQSGDQIRSYDEAKRYACKLNSQVYNEQDENYWYRYYNGEERGSDTFLGGSMVFNLADMTNIFGLNGGPDIYRSVYNTFGNIQSKLYPEDLPSIVPYEKAVDKSLLMGVMLNHPDLLEGKALETQYANNITETVSNRSVQIQFELGSAVIKRESYMQLDDIFNSATVADGLKIGIYGHTDKSGSDRINIPLSKSRAQAVADYLLKKGISYNRIEVEGYGSSKPIGSAYENRRVEIVLGK